MLFFKLGILAVMAWWYDNYSAHLVSSFLTCHLCYTHDTVTHAKLIIFFFFFFCFFYFFFLFFFFFFFFFSKKRIFVKIYLLCTYTGHRISFNPLKYYLVQKLALLKPKRHGVRRNQEVSNTNVTASSSHPIQYPLETYFTVPYMNAFNI